jgi:hypothetical protein
MGGVNFLSTPGFVTTATMNFVPLSAGNFTVDIVATDDGSPPAVTTFPMYFNISGCNVSVGEANAHFVSISPNPVSDELHIFSEGQYHLRVTDVAGKLIHEANGYDNYLIDVSSWSDGMYFLTMTSGKNSDTVKLLKY